MSNDGFPTVITRSWEIPKGTSMIPERDLNSRNIYDIDDLFAVGITAASAVTAK